MAEVKQVSLIMDIPKKLANTLLEDNHWNIDQVIKNYKYLKEATFKKPKYNKNINLQTNDRPLMNSDLSLENGFSNRDSLLMIPNINIGDKLAILENNVFNNFVLNSLQEDGKVNWWFELGFGSKLYPLICDKIEISLFESISIAIWGTDDYTDLIASSIKNLIKDTYFKNLVYNQWVKENSDIFDVDIKNWEILIISYINHLTGLDNSIIEDQYNIESFLIYLVSHVLKRPIVIISNEIHNKNKSNSSYNIQDIQIVNNDGFNGINGDVIKNLNSSHQTSSIKNTNATKKPIGGFYIPINLTDKCNKSPVLLAYLEKNYYALAPMEEGCDPIGIVYKTLLPIVQKNNDLFNIHFIDENNASIDEKDKNYFNILQKYLNIEYYNKNQPLDTVQPILEGMVWNNCDSESTELPNSKRPQNIRRKIGKSFSSIRRSINFLLNHVDEPLKKNNDMILKYDATNVIPCMRCSFARIKEYESALIYRLEVAAALNDNLTEESNTTFNSSNILTENFSGSHLRYQAMTPSLLGSSGSVHKESCMMHGSPYLSTEINPLMLKSKENKFCVKNAQLRRLQFTHSKSEDAGYQKQISIPSTSSHNEDVRFDCPLNNSINNLGGKSLENVKSMGNLNCKVHNDLTRFDLRDYLSEEMIKVMGSEVSVIGSEVYEKGKEFLATDVMNESFVEKLVHKNGCE